MTSTLTDAGTTVMTTQTWCLPIWAGDTQKPNMEIGMVSLRDSDLRKNEPHMVAHSCNSRTWEIDTRGSGVQSNLQLC